MQTGWKTFGHEQAKSILSKHLAGQNLPHCYLFSGPKGLGKKQLAVEFATRVLGTENLDAHPDFLMFDQTEPAAIEQVRDFISRLSLKPFIGQKKVAVINNAELLNVQSANALLKTLEEPSESTVIILVGDGERLLPTIRSRCLILSLQLLSDQQLAEFAKENSLKVSPELISLSFGSPAELMRLAKDPKLAQERQQELGQFAQLKHQGMGQRLLAIGKLADMENADLSDKSKICAPIRIATPAWRPCRTRWSACAPTKTKKACCKHYC
jgi:DNA polymerase-3 subunit delta'